MPRHKVHRLIDRIFLGREYPDIHRWMDEPYKRLGPRHRMLRHDLLSCIIVSRGDPRRLASAILHLLLDGEL